MHPRRESHQAGRKNPSIQSTKKLGNFVLIYIEEPVALPEQEFSASNTSAGAVSYTEDRVPRRSERAIVEPVVEWLDGFE